ncbi:Carboxypeptidase B [Scenedesmus sp. PABB004]|nr:Carboxypeptidase B [Scenedesmus sp. PABB004]
MGALARRRLAAAALLLAAAAPAASLYHTSGELLHWFSATAAKHPGVMRFRDVRDYHSKTLLPLATITAGADVAPAPAKPAVLFVFGEHAREVITSEVGVWLARVLVDNSSAAFDWPELGAALARAGVDAAGASVATGAGAGGGASGGAGGGASGGDGGGGAGVDWPSVARRWVREVLGVLEVGIIPIEALDSRRQVEEGALCVRKTARNVDLNRNWPFAWRRGSPADEQYGGPSPFSEPQSRLVRHVVDGMRGRLVSYVNVHSGEWAAYTPWDSKPAYGGGLPADLPDLMAKVGRLCGCRAGPAGAVSGYLAFGSSMDYVYAHHAVPYPLTVEVFGGGGEGLLAPGAAARRGAAPRRAPPRGRHALRRARALTLPAAPAPPRRGPGEANKALTAFDVVEPSARAAAAAPAAAPQPRRLLQVQPGGGGGPGRRLAALWRRLAGAAPGRAPLQAAAGGGGGGFSHADALPQLRQQALLQLAEQQQAPGAGAAADPLLSLLRVASPSDRACFAAFNPASEAEYRRVVADWLAAFLVVLRHVADSPAARAVAAGNATAPGG